MIITSAKLSKDGQFKLPDKSTLLKIFFYLINQNRCYSISGRVSFEHMKHMLEIHYNFALKSFAYLNLRTVKVLVIYIRLVFVFAEEFFGITKHSLRFPTN